MEEGSRTNSPRKARAIKREDVSTMIMIGVKDFRASSTRDK
jgi:hypothetical protein